MKKLLIYFIFLISVNLFSQVVPTKIYPNDSVKFYFGNQVSIWGNTYNHANSTNGGNLNLAEGAVVIVYGDSFKNINSSNVDGGGEIRMLRPRPSPYPNAGNQIFVGGGNGSSIPDLTVNSPNHVYLTQDLKVRDSIKMINGCVVLNLNDLTLGNGGNISGYKENSYIVTNGGARDTLKGYFIRENVGNFDAVFPVGFSLNNDYTPAIINNSGTSDLFKMRVFDTVFQNGYYHEWGNPNTLAVTRQSVQRTWDIREGTQGGSNVNLTLQYNIATEGPSPLFADNRNYSFITHYVGYNPNYEGDTVSHTNWDNFTLASTSAPVSPGTLTTGSPINSAAMKTRGNITSFSPFTITYWEPINSPLPQYLVFFKAKKTNSNSIGYYWSVNENVNLKKYKFYYKTNSNGQFIEFYNLSLNNPISQLNQYNNFHSFPFDLNENLFLKIELIGLNNQVIEEKIIALAPNQNQSKFTIYPNPNNGQFSLLGENIEEINQFEIFDQVGKLVYAIENKDLNNIISIPTLSRGTYYIKFVYQEKIQNLTFVID